VVVWLARTLGNDLALRRFLEHLESRKVGTILLVLQAALPEKLG